MSQQNQDKAKSKDGYTYEPTIFMYGDKFFKIEYYDSMVNKGEYTAQDEEGDTYEKYPIFNIKCGSLNIALSQFYKELGENMVINNIFCYTFTTISL